MDGSIIRTYNIQDLIHLGYKKIKKVNWQDFVYWELSYNSLKDVYVNKHKMYVGNYYKIIDPLNGLEGNYWIPYEKDIDFVVDLSNIFNTGASVKDLFKIGFRTITRKDFPENVYVNLFENNSGDNYLRIAEQIEDGKIYKIDSDLLIGDNWVPYNYFSV